MNFEDKLRTGVVTVEPNGAKARLGINSKYNPDMPPEFWTCDVAQALEMAAIREQARYWQPLHIDGVASQDVANKIFDMAINTSVREAGVLTQRALALKEDGMIGPITLAAIASADPVVLLDRLRVELRAYYEEIEALHPDLARWMHGYLVRAAA